MNHLSWSSSEDIFQPSFQCGGSSNATTLQDLALYVDIYGVLQSLLAATGVSANLLTLSHLLLSKRKQTQSIFHSLFAILLLSGTLFLLANLFEIFRQQGRIPRGSYLSEVIFAFLVYPAKTCSLYCSVYLTVVMARERYVGLRWPVRYHNETLRLNPWREAASLALPVAAFSGVFVLPIFFEARVVEAEDRPDKEKYESYLTTDDNREKVMSPIYKLVPSNLRFNDLYVLLYKNIATFIFTMVLPCSLLAIYNWRILVFLRRRRRLLNRPHASSAAQKLSICLKVEEARKAYVLLSITVLFVLCHLGRFLLRLHECVFVAQYQKGVRDNCNPSPLWVLVLQSVSNLMLTVNSGFCSLFYCLTSRDFHKDIRMICAWFREANGTRVHVADEQEQHHV